MLRQVWFLFCAFNVTQAFAQRATLTVTPKELRVGETMEVRITIPMAAGGGIMMGAPEVHVPNFAVRSQSSEIQMGFGPSAMTVVLEAEALRTGEFRVGPFEIQGMRTSSMPVKVVPGPARRGRQETQRRQQDPFFDPFGMFDQMTQRGQQAQPDPFDPVEPENSQEPLPDPAATQTPPILDEYLFDQNAFVRITADKKTVVPGEPVDVTVFLYTRTPIVSSPQYLQEMATDGFWIQNLLPSQYNLERGVTHDVQGQTFHVYVLKHFVAFALHEGGLQMSPLKARFGIRQSGGFFARGVQVERESKPLLFQVNPLPPGVDFVGALDVQTTLNSQTATTGEALTLTMTIKSSGNLSNLPVPKLKMDGLRILEPEIKEDQEVKDAKHQSIRVIRWVIVPEVPGAYTLPFASIKTYDPRSKQISPLTMNAVSFEVLGATLPSHHEARKTEQENPNDHAGQQELDKLKEQLLSEGPLGSAPTTFSVKLPSWVGFSGWGLALFGLLFPLYRSRKAGRGPTANETLAGWEGRIAQATSLKSAKDIVVQLLELKEKQALGSVPLDDWDATLQTLDPKEKDQLLSLLKNARDQQYAGIAGDDTLIKDALLRHARSWLKSGLFVLLFLLSGVEQSTQAQVTGYNLARTHIQNEQYGKALVELERASLLSGGHDPIERTKERAEDYILKRAAERDGSSTQYNHDQSLLPFNPWVLQMLWIVLACMGSTFAWVTLFKFSRRHFQVWRAMSLVALLLSLVTFLMHQKRVYAWDDARPVVLTRDVALQTSPEKGSSTMHQLRDGFRADRLRVFGEFARVKTAYGEGWVPADAVSSIDPWE